MKSLEGSAPAKVFDLIDVLVPPVVSVTGHALGVLVGEGAAQCLNHGERGEVFGGDELDPTALPTLLLLDQVVDFWVYLVERCVSPLVYWIHFWGRVRERENDIEREGEENGGGEME